MDYNVVRFSFVHFYVKKHYLVILTVYLNQVSAVNILDSFRFQVYLVDSGGKSITREGKIVGFDPDYDLAVLKVLKQV